MKVVTNYDNGGADVVSLNAAAQRVTLAPRDVDGAKRLFIRARLEDLDPTLPLTIDLADFHTPAGAVHLLWSTDGVNWLRSANQHPPYVIEAGAASVEVSRNVPYSVGDAQRMVDDLAGSDRVTVDTLCDTPAGRPVHLMRFASTGRSGATGSRRHIFVVARLHAFESHPCHVAEGLARWLVSSDPAAASLLRDAVVHLVPIADVDGVAEGCSGKDRMPVDFNRDWTDAPTLPTIRAMVDYLASLAAESRQAMFFDLHSPWYPEPHHWHAAPGIDPSLLQRFGDTFDRQHAAANAPNDWKQWFKTDSYDRCPTASVPYVHDRWMAGDPQAVALCMEIAHWRDASGRFITREGLLAYGATLGRTIAALA